MNKCPQECSCSWWYNETLMGQVLNCGSFYSFGDLKENEWLYWVLVHSHSQLPQKWSLSMDSKTRKCRKSLKISIFNYVYVWIVLSNPYWVIPALVIQSSVECWAKTLVFIIKSPARHHGIQMGQSKYFGRYRKFVCTLF